MRVIWVNKSPTPYSDIFFQALFEKENIEFKVYNLWRESFQRPWKLQLATGYDNTYMRLFLGVDWGLLKTAWLDVNSFFIVGDWAHLPTLAVILARWWRKAPIAIWADTPQEDVKRPLLKKMLRSKFLRWLLARVDIIFGTGKKALRVLSDMGARDEQLVDLPWTLDTLHPARACQKLEVTRRAQELRQMIKCNSEGMVFAIIGTLIERKRQEVGLQAFARCRRETDKPMGMIIAGEGPDRIKVESLAHRLGLGESIAFLGWQEPEEMDAVYLATDIVVHPAKVEPYGLVILETMNWSKVIISSDVCGATEDRVVPGLNGFSFPAEDVAGLSKIMLDLVIYPEKLKDIGAQARKTVEEWPVERGVEIVVEAAKRIVSPKKIK